MSDLIEARWVPAYSVSLPDGRVLNQNDTALITPGEAKASDHWQPVKAAKPKSEDS